MGIGAGIGGGGGGGGDRLKAWVNFNGTGTVAIRDEFNVSSIDDNGTGLYDINFTSSMADANYAPVAVNRQNTLTAGVPDSSYLTTASIEGWRVRDSAGTLADYDLVGCAVFGN